MQHVFHKRPMWSPKPVRRPAHRLRSRLARSGPGPRGALDQQQFRRGLFERLPVPLVLLDVDVRLVTVNAATRGLFSTSAPGKETSAFDLWLSQIQPLLRSAPPGWFRNGLELVDCSQDAAETRESSDLPQFDTLVGRYEASQTFGEYVCVLLPAGHISSRSQQLARFFEQSLDLFCIADLEGYFHTINANFSRRLGYTDAELTGRPFLSFIHPEDVAATETAMSNLTDGEDVVAFCNRYRDIHGVYTWFEWTARALPDEGLVFASARDVSDRMEMESQLRLQEQRERAILDNTSAVIYVKDNQGRYQFVNREFSRLFRVSQAEAEGKTDFDLFPDGVAAVFQRNDRQVLESKLPLKIEEVAPHGDGLHNYLSVKFPLFNADGDAVSVAGISTDISDRVWLQRTTEELRLAREVQRRLFPVGDLRVSGYDIHGKVLAASHLCGDYFDYVVRPNGNVVCCVADVSGHGLAPALEMVATRAMLRMLLKESRPLNETIAVLNRLLHDDMPDGSFVTMFLAELSPSDRHFWYVGAAHDAVLFRNDGTIEELPSTGTMLGLFEDASFSMSAPIPLSTGDLLLMCTDGIHETMSPDRELFGHERVRRAVTLRRHLSAATILDELFSMAHAYSCERMPKDDMTGIIVKALATL